MMQSSSDHRQREVLRIAFELQAAHAASEEQKLSEAAFREAALETGLDPQLLARAEEELARRERVAAEAAVQRRRRTRLAVVAVLGVLALGGAGLGLARVLFPPPPAPWVETFDAPGRWALDKNPDTRATLSWQAEPGRGQVAVVQVDGFAPAQDGKFHVNLDGLLAPEDVSRYRELVVDLKGSLPGARVYLEAGTDERWRSPAISVQRDWTTHRLPLRSFERQQRQGGTWRTVDWSAPEGVSQLSVKVGHFMNPPEATGALFVDALWFESP
ncbi:MAG TPA: hypothetical protein VNM90_16665 [Haliangium sp.]|nr:hypothetical protein [Haliangium sp.]